MWLKQYRKIAGQSLYNQMTCKKNAFGRMFNSNFTCDIKVNYVSRKFCILFWHVWSIVHKTIQKLIQLYNSNDFSLHELQHVSWQHFVMFWKEMINHWSSISNIECNIYIKVSLYQKYQCHCIIEYFLFENNRDKLT